MIDLSKLSQVRIMQNYIQLLIKIKVLLYFSQTRLLIKKKFREVVLLGLLNQISQCIQKNLQGEVLLNKIWISFKINSIKAKGTFYGVLKQVGIKIRL